MGSYFIPQMQVNEIYESWGPLQISYFKNNELFPGSVIVMFLTFFYLNIKVIANKKLECSAAITIRKEVSNVSAKTFHNPKGKRRED